MNAGHQALLVAGDEVYGGNPKLRAILKESGTGYVLAVARTHEVTNQARKFRADALANKLPKRAWQKLSAGAGAKGSASPTGPTSTCAGRYPAATTGPAVT